MAYITENVIAMGFPAGDMSSGFFGYVEGKYKVYNLCPERLYDASLFEGRRFVKYFEHTLTYFNGEVQPKRRAFWFRGRLYWMRPSFTVSNHHGDLFSTKTHPRTKDLLAEVYWFSIVDKGFLVYTLPGEALAEVDGDFKVQFHDRHGDFYLLVF
ncbi:hypothetical protein HS088_TW02G00196 [Tripterygium wilfordii]|uniref:PTEN2A/B C2 domain-containing protein n=1 Tax=Tripterygium wilfordii TaxID=458696 RepID=A0A7J7DYN9_TRIWF|nr:hypothetical protein HS088_TW02G00196 [Tripterygium wilfordii]